MPATLPSRPAPTSSVIRETTRSGPTRWGSSVTITAWRRRVTASMLARARTLTGPLPVS